MVDNSQKSDKNLSIQIKISLKRTILQLEKAIEIIKNNSIEDLPNLTIVENLVDSSNALVDYLQLKKASITNETQTENKLPENNDISENKRENKTIKGRIKTKRKFNLNLILIILLIISLITNIIIWNLKSNNLVMLSEEEKIIVEDKETLVTNKMPTIENNHLSKSDTPINNYPDEEIKVEEKISPESKEIESNSENKINTNLEIDTNNLSKDSKVEELNLNVTPEQSLLTNIENEIKNITNKYGNKLILYIEANFSTNNLVITFSQDWYKLTENEQNNVVNDVFDKVKNLNFYKFNIKDANNNLLARNAVIGNKIIIVNRGN
ncbi:MAG: hypothetical protein GW795_02595 [Cyanobacteria bacterium]|nr:hypothetical protein [Cyanobacteria bacterium CG_2015-16_32_12]NCO78926.1 hypothetical protein [Cyanobacteria bacterium CG_2015-22_32_23]NCQ04947.1 hypothetical protein [Cyanobacteria bacterium CG_2015-09_32_10]NCQ40790.1 hypothetical protein [Cyanobacteria bacterium CG_2015-04_32_10]NCS83799.1 hypothetical protein [Cyanobacteria bacterium CG_2015-02_32_10]